MTTQPSEQPRTRAGRAHFQTFVDNQHHDNVDAAYECSDDVDRCDSCAQEVDDILAIEAEAAAPDPAERIVAAAQEWEATTDFAERDFGDQRLLLALAYAVAQDDGRAGDAGPDLSTAAPDPVASPRKWDYNAPHPFESKDLGNPTYDFCICERRRTDAMHLPDPVASPNDDWVICQNCEGDGGWPTSAAPQPLDHGYSPRPDWAGTCPRCGAKAGDNCAVLPDPVASPRVTAEHLEAAIGKALYGWADNEPNDATGWTTRTEVKRVVLAVMETLMPERELVALLSLIAAARAALPSEGDLITPSYLGDSEIREGEYGPLRPLIPDPAAQPPPPTEALRLLRVIANSADTDGSDADPDLIDEARRYLATATEGEPT